jgi:hypothetical protein
MENRHGLMVAPRLIQPASAAEREAGVALVEGFPGSALSSAVPRPTVPRNVSSRCGPLKAVPHVAQNNKGWKSAIDGRTTRHPGYAVSQRLRKRVEVIFGLMKTVGNLRMTRHRGEDGGGPLFSPSLRRPTIWCLLEPEKTPKTRLFPQQPAFVEGTKPVFSDNFPFIIVRNPSQRGETA